MGGAATTDANGMVDGGAENGSNEEVVDEG
jgi:hypothetical protein